MNKFLTFLLLIILVACNEPIRFEQPQPARQRNLNKIPRQLRGTYLSTSDSTYLTIDQQVIVDWADVEVIALRDSLDLDIDSADIAEMSDSVIQVIYGDRNLNIMLMGDSAKVHYFYRDTIFEISDEQLVRRYKGHYFLNYRKGKYNWRVRKLTLENKLLSFSEIISPKDITNLKEITEVKEIRSDSGKVIGYKLNPTRKELRKLMKHNFGDVATYRKLE